MGGAFEQHYRAVGELLHAAFVEASAEDVSSESFGVQAAV
jgi:hypothetical protein